MARLLNTASILMCPHGGTVSIVSQNVKAIAAGAPLIRASDTFLVAGCALSGAMPPSPCVRVQWTEPKSGSRAAGDFVLNENNPGKCISGTQADQGTVLVVSTQDRVVGS